MTGIKRAVFLPSNRVSQKIVVSDMSPIIDLRYVKMSGEVNVSRLTAEYSYINVAPHSASVKGKVVPVRN
jgi:hypothetical protein